MTVKEKMLKLLTDNGLWPDMADEVLLEYTSEPTMPDIKLEDAADSYPIQFWAVVWLGLKRVALEWIDANKPKAWFRPMFTDNPPK